MYKITAIPFLIALFYHSAWAQAGSEAQTLAQEGFEHTEAFVEYRSTLASTDETGLGRANAGAWRFGPADREYRKAISAFKKSIRLDPGRFDTPEALLYLFLYNRYHEELNPDRRDLPSADSVTLAMRTSFPREPRAWLYRGLVLYMLGDEESAQRQFDLGKALLPAPDLERFDEPHACLLQTAPPGARRRGEFEDPFLLTPVNEREVAHYGRTVYADLYYPGWRETFCGPGQITPGEVIVRYGIPAKDETPSKSRARGEISADPRLVLFINTGRFTFSFQQEIEGEWFVHQSRIQDRREVIRNVPEAGDPPVKTPFDMQFLVSRFRDANGSNEVVVSAGIPIVAPPDDGGVPLAVLTGMFVVDPSLEIADAAVQSFASLSRRQIIDADTLHMWTNANVLRAAAGEVKIKVEAESAQLISNNFQTLQIDSLSGFGVSDLLFAYWVDDALGDAPPGAVQRNGYQIQPAAVNLFDREVPLYVYFEVYGLTPCEDNSLDYRLEVLLNPARENTGLLGVIGGLFSRKSAGSVAVSFDRHVSGPSTGDYFILNSEDFEPGMYEMTLVITDANSGEEAHAARTVILK